MVTLICCQLPFPCERLNGNVTSVFSSSLYTFHEHRKPHSGWMPPSAGEFRYYRRLKDEKKIIIIIKNSRNLGNYFKNKAKHRYTGGGSHAEFIKGEHL